MIRQAFRTLAVLFFAHRDLQPLRNAISRIVSPVWPAYAPESLASQPLSAPADWRWRRVDAALDINPGSGEAFFEGRRPQGAAASGPVDLLCHAFVRRTRREPSLVLYCGAQASAADFACVLLPRFFALDELGAPQDLLLLMQLEMGAKRYFQDALIDQVFHPRPIELMRKRRVVHVETLHEIAGPLASPAILSRIASRMAAVYGPFEPEGAPVFLCEGGAARAQAIADAYRDKLPAFFAAPHTVVDPGRTPLRRVVRALASAPVVAAPNTGEAAFLALAPRPSRVLHELAVSGGPHPLAAELVDALAEERRVLL
ncbi:MAG: hypothetical protein JWN93_1310 [Hyphomicrobiales bacterium]|nr:hypothetical protein [Hyphomicrobiales bacterium]